METLLRGVGGAEALWIAEWHSLESTAEDAVDLL